MNKILDFYADALRTIKDAATPKHIEAMDRIMIQAQAQIAQDRLLGVIERLVSPRPASGLDPGTTESGLAQAVVRAIVEQQEMRGDEQGYHPSPFAADIDLGPDEPELSPEEAEADRQLKERMKSDINKTMEQIVKGSK
jgi:hypothetical protein